MKPERGAAPPAWALALVRAVAAEHELRPAPTLIWERPEHAEVAWTNGPLIRVWASRRETRERRALVLHELAHLLAGIGHGHAAAWRGALDELLARWG